MSDAALAKIEPGGGVMTSPQGESAALISMIERLARDPTVDLARVQSMIELRERIEDREAKRSFLVALADMQPHLPIVHKNGSIEIPSKDDKKPTQKPSKFAKIEDIDEATRPIYTAYGFSVTYGIKQTAERITAVCIVAHRGGYERETEFSSPIEGTGFKNNTQAWGSALTYCKRYAFCAALNIVTKGVDDDGKKAQPPDCITEDQAGTLRELIESVDGKLAPFLAYFKISTLSELPVSQFDRAMTALRKRAGQ